MTPEEAQRLAEVEKKAACTEIIANKNEEIGRASCRERV